MKKETYTFIIGLGIGYGVKKFMDKPITAAKADFIQGIKKKVTDEFFKLLWCQSPEEYYDRQRYRGKYKVKNDPYEDILNNLEERLYSNGEITLEDVENAVKEVKGE